MTDKKLWKTFSEYIRRRDADKDGLCRCFTCGKTIHWKKAHAGHGIPRQHNNTKYNEKNVHSQCVTCNTFEGGRMDLYMRNMDKAYGEGSWDLMWAKARMRGKRLTAFEAKVLEDHYKAELKKFTNE